jgi:hypothetical protein
MSKARYHIIKNGIKSEYNAFINMRLRCSKPSHPEYHRYGGRGIKVCAEWFNDFDQFLFDMGRKPKGTCRKDEWSLDRIDNNKGYCKENCRWSQRVDQQQNMESNKKITINGKSLTARKWHEISGVRMGTIIQRRNKGFPESVLLHPKRLGKIIIQSLTMIDNSTPIDSKPLR